MDPSAVVGASNSSRRKEHRRRVVSEAASTTREIELSNSSRRSSAVPRQTKTPPPSRSSCKGGVCVCGRCVDKITSTHRTTTSASSSVAASSSTVHRSVAVSSADRRGGHRSSKEDDSNRRSSHQQGTVKDAEQQNLHVSSSSHGGHSQTSRHHSTHRDNNDDVHKSKRTSDKQQSKSSSSRSSTRPVTTTSTAKMMSRNAVARRSSSDSNKSSNNNKQPSSSSPLRKSSSASASPSNSSTKNHQKEKSNSKRRSADNNCITSSNTNSNNSFEVFYDEQGRKITVPITAAALKATASDDDDEKNSSDIIEGVSDFDDDELVSEEDDESDKQEYIDGASELDDNYDDYDDDYDDDEEDKEYNDIDVVGTMTNLPFELEAKEENVNKNGDLIGALVGGSSKTNNNSTSSGVTMKRSNSPELNYTRRQPEPQSAMERIIRTLYGEEIDPSTNISSSTSSTMGGEKDDYDIIKNNINNMDPNEDASISLRKDRPPTPESDHCNHFSDNLSQISIRGQDPPEEGRGCDPPSIVPSSASGAVITTKSSSKPRQSSVRNSVPNKQGKEKKKPEIRGILKKKEGAAPPPIAYFGKTASQSTSDDDDDDDDDKSDDSGTEYSLNDIGSDPDVSETKSKEEGGDEGSDILSLFEDKSVSTASVSTAKSGLRRGRFAAANAAAAAATNLETINDDESSSNDESKDDSYRHYNKRSNSADFNNSFPSLMGDDQNRRFNRKKSHFLRTSDLGLTQDTIFAEQFLDDPGARPEPHYHHPSPHPPPGIQFNCDENWISVDDGNGDHSPIAPQAVDALVATGFRTACDPMMWTPSAKTRKLMTERGLRFDDIPTPAPPEEEGGRGDPSCLIWSGKFPHKYYGHDVPVIRSQGIVNMSPEELVDLLMDSTRVQSYNISSMGRKDELMLSDGTKPDSCPFSGQRKKKLTGVVIQGAKIVNGAAVGFDEETDDEQSDYEEEEVTEMEFDDDGNRSVRKYTSLTSSKKRRKSIFVGVTKLVRSTNKVPMRKNLEYVTLLHCRKLTDEQGGNGYIIVGRAVTPAEDAEKGGKDAHVQRAEILLNVHIIRRLREKKSKRKKHSSRSLMINVVHVKSPIVPNMLAKKVGLSAAGSFLVDIRALTDE